MPFDANILLKINNLLNQIYGNETAAKAYRDLVILLKKYQAKLNEPASFPDLDQTDVILITYGDMLNERGEKPLRTLHQFLQDYTAEIISSIHILPFFPYSSDDGFSVINYREVNPQLGDWDDIAHLGKDFKLMVDLVANHVSAESEWFIKYLRGLPPYKDYFIEIVPGADLSKVFRPRALPLWREVETADGKKLVWTTFSQDQIDLNYRNYKVLLEIIDIMLFYVEKSAKFIRLDAIAYIWKEIGTTCIHRPEVHWIVQLMRSVLDLVAPAVKLITETNVPHEENISYFGDGTNEAHLVYNFSLPPLVLYSFYKNSAEQLTKWAKNLELPSGNVSFLNFLASHDGIGITPLSGILDEDEILQIAHHIEKIGGYVSYKTNADGSESPYELNINYFDALSDSSKGVDEEKDLIKKFVCAHAIMLSFKGMPAIYFHSLFGSRSWLEGVNISGQKRAINREKFEDENLRQELSDSSSRRNKIFSQLSNLLLIRKQESAFAPSAIQCILSLHNRLFSLIRYAKGSNSLILCIHNVSSDEVPLRLSLSQLGVNSPEAINVLMGEKNAKIFKDSLVFRFDSFSFTWIKIFCKSVYQPF